ncbi:LysR family transcriptional regulator [Paenibacillus sp. P96]|uniref:LysR family transcriptional regulator n=1 Tax=Paenibacillus zeirhizosphaerae TaxID=2987519 RepID=A0ABT9FQU7_9BACL|nr:LysR family transcriptional regulator [Paenibacillus sp. P96]MDP4096807.1 LysR family transcriptional regulator [Paenibacillus sp. P96]
MIGLKPFVGAAVMDEKDCLMLIYIEEERSLVRAADRLYITQPALTYRLNQLEKSFGIPVIIRGAKGGRLTPEGERLVEYARRHLAGLAELRDAVLHLRNEVRGTLRLGISSYFGLYKLPPILKTFKDSYPDVQFSVTCALSSEIYAMLQNDEIHVGVIRNEHPWSEGKDMLQQESICVISTEPIELHKLPSLPLIRYKAPKTAGGLPPSSFSEAVQAWWKEKQDKPPLISMEVDSYETCKEMVKHGLGYSIVPRIFVAPSDQLYTLDLVLDNGEPILRTTWMLYKNKAIQLAVVSRFVEWMKQEMAR